MPANSTRTAIHRFVEAARSGTLARTVAPVRSGWIVLGDPQILSGYCLLLPDPVVSDLHDLAPVDRLQFLDDLARLGQAVVEVTGAYRVNYEMLGNVEPALHAHVIPRYWHEPDTLRGKPVWFHDWDAAPRFDAGRDRALLERLRAALERLGAVRPAHTAGQESESRVLLEITQVRQVDGEPRRRWFTSSSMDLVVWLDDDDAVAGFQLCYGRPTDENALTWRRGQGWSHARVDDGEDRPGKHKASPILLPGGSFDRHALATLFRVQCGEIDRDIAEFVSRMLGSEDEA